MQELMSRHKAYSLSPRDCLKTTLFQKWQRMVAPPGKRGTFYLHTNEWRFSSRPHSNPHPNQIPLTKSISRSFYVLCFDFRFQNHFPKDLSESFAWKQLELPITFNDAITQEFPKTVLIFRWTFMLHENNFYLTIFWFHFFSLFSVHLLPSRQKKPNHAPCCVCVVCWLCLTLMFSSAEIDRQNKQIETLLN